MDLCAPLSSEPNHVLMNHDNFFLGIFAFMVLSALMMDASLCMDKKWEHKVRGTRKL